MKRLFFAVGAFIGFVLCSAVVSAAEKYTLAEPADDARVFRVELRPEVKGQLDTSTGDGKLLAHDLAVQATLRYLERRLSGTGRDAEAFRSLRKYEDADAQINVSKQLTSSRLRDDRRLIVAQGRREGVSFYSPDGRMSYGEIELLRAPADSLAVLSLLPPKPVELKEKWSVPSWGAQMIVGSEAAVKAEITCELESVEKDLARVRFSGRVEGATAGAQAEIDVTGHYLFDMKTSYLKRLEMTQKDKRTVGPVTPGMRITATIGLDRQPAARVDVLTDEAVKRIPLDPDPALVHLEFRSSWNVQFEYDRNWHVFHQSEKIALLRLVETGSLIAQCNVSPVPAAAPGQHTSDEQFQKDIRTSLGNRFKSIEKAELLKGEDGCYRYRVVAVGEANKIPMHWIYYLCADPSGRQIAFVFAVESKLLEQLGNRDLAIVQSVNFQTARVPETAGGK